jgi:hypothetical protein
MGANVGKIHRGLASLLAALAAGGASAGVRIDIDRETLSGIVASLAATTVDVPIAGGTTLRVELRDVRVTGLEPGTPERPGDGIRTSVRVLAPDIGLDASITPRLALGLADVSGVPMLELRFAELPLTVPLVGRVDLARVVAPLRYPAQNVLTLPGGAREVDLTSRLSRIGMTADALRLEFDVRPTP